jgi:hypothetical protein
VPFHAGIVRVAESYFATGIVRGIIPSGKNADDYSQLDKSAGLLALVGVSQLFSDQCGGATQASSDLLARIAILLQTARFDKFVEWKRRSRSTLPL